MRKFVRQKSSNGGTAPPDVNLDFGAAAAKLPKVLSRMNTDFVSNLPASSKATRTF